MKRIKEKDLKDALVRIREQFEGIENVFNLQGIYLDKKSCFYAGRGAGPFTEIDGLYGHGLELETQIDTLKEKLDTVIERKDFLRKAIKRIGILEEKIDLLLDHHNLEYISKEDAREEVGSSLKLKRRKDEKS